MEKKRTKKVGEKGLKKKAISHFRDDQKYYRKESLEDSENIKAIKKRNSLPKKKLVKHLKGDVKGFKGEIQEDQELIHTLKGKKNGRKKKACCKDCERGKSCAGKRKQNAQKTRRLQRR